jgi:hypothetical protein
MGRGHERPVKLPPPLLVERILVATRGEKGREKRETREKTDRPGEAKRLSFPSSLSFPASSGGHQ